MEQKPNDLTGKVGLITGAAHRIGAQIARTLHAQGMDLVLHYRHSVDAARQLKQQLETKNRRPDSILLLQADLHHTASFPGLMERIETARGRLDVLVNNASSFFPTRFCEATEEQWNELLGTNLKAPFFLAQAGADLLKASQGSIVNLVDIHAQRPLKDYPIYSIAKAGNAMLVKALARELGPHVRVNGVSPGVILWPERGMPEASREKILARTALKRAGSPLDIARTVLFLVRDADYITGQIIAVDGGRTLQH